MMKTCRLASLLAMKTTLVTLFLMAGCAAPKAQAEPERLQYDPPTEMPALANEEPVEREPSEVEAKSAAAPAPTSSPVAVDTPVAEPEDLVIATVSGEPVYVSDLLRRLMMSDSRVTLDHFRGLLEERMVMLEAERMGISLNPAAVDDAVIDIRAKIESDLAEQQPGLGFEEYFKRFRGMDPDNYIAGIRAAQVRGMLLERVARTWLLTQEHTAVRVIIVRTEELGQQVQEALDAGRPFEEVASELSEDVSRENGGLLPPVVRGDQTLLSRLAFSNPEGTIVGPVENGSDLVWVQVLESPKPLVANWSIIEPLVEADLKRRPLDDYEFLQWKSSVSIGYEMDPAVFLNLIGEAPKGP